jgi:predicted AlkP superfamily phosphohydrolase/phosphomutase
MSRVFMIGWDGATFDLIHPWVREGKLPHIARLMQAGVHGPLQSTLPSWTFTAWSSFLTGNNPGKHGLYDFFRPVPGSYELEFTHGGHRHGASFWQLLSAAGRHVVSVSVPCTFPPEPVNGAMISGFDVLGSGPGAYVDARGMYPPGLFDELKQHVGLYPLDAKVMKEINEGRPEGVLERIEDTIRRKAAVAKYLLRSRPWDCFMMHFGESDGAGHHFWKYMDPASPLYSTQPAGMGDAILRVYQALDRQVGELTAELPADTTVLMMSDHGFGGVSNWVLYPNWWLHDRGLLSFRSGLKRRLARSLDNLKLWAVGHLSPKVKRWLYRRAKGQLARLEAHVRYGTIHWPATRAYFDENPYYPSLRVNLKGRQPQGVVEPGKEYAELRDRLIRELEALRHPETGEPVVEKALRREEVYAGPRVDVAPDIVVKWALHQGYSYAFRISSKSPRRRWIEQADPGYAHNQHYYGGKSGTHRDHGIFVGSGPGVRRGGRVEGARIMDLAPTILHLVGVPVPEDMDGRVLQEILAECTAAPVRDQATNGRATAGAAGVVNGDGYSCEEEAKVAERLTALGYLGGVS